jgi:hypothetical protein
VSNRWNTPEHAETKEPSLYVPWQNPQNANAHISFPAS